MKMLNLFIGHTFNLVEKSSLSVFDSLLSYSSAHVILIQVTTLVS